ncbi:MAG: hypothetical protein ACF788_11100 [Novipirellula sp. JB048]
MPAPAGEPEHGLPPRLTPNRPLAPPQYWIELLDADQYATRKKAVAHLLSDAHHPNRTAEARRAVHESLLQALEHESLEVRWQSRRLLRQIEQATREDQIERLLNPRADAASIDLLGWQSFAELVGDDRASRRFYAHLYQAQTQRIESWLRVNVSETPRAMEPIATDARRVFNSLQTDDLDGWALLLFVDSLTPRRTQADLSTPMMIALAHSNLAPDLARAADAALLRRLIRAWLVRHATIGNRCDQLLIAMRYQCKPLATQLCMRILDDRDCPASWQTTAMLAASALGSSPSTFPANHLDAILISRLGDKRTAARWQLVPARQTTIQTQVGDVAMAMLLHRHQLDPRRAGFSELQADPMLIYRDHSIGFGDDSQRERAHRQAMGLLREIGFDLESFSAHAAATDVAR